MKQTQAGFTLIEVLVSMTVITVVVLFIAYFLLNNVALSVRATDRGEVLSQTEQSLDQLTQAIRLSANADDQNEWADANGPNGNQYGWSSNSTTLVLAQAATTTSGQIIFSDPETYITTKNNLIFFLKNGTLYERILAAPVSGNSAVTTCPSSDSSPSCPPDHSLLSNISSLSFNYYNGENQVVTPSSARAVQLDVKVSESAYNEPFSVNYSTWMVFRND